MSSDSDWDENVFLESVQQGNRTILTISVRGSTLRTGTFHFENRSTSQPSAIETTAQTTSYNQPAPQTTPVLQPIPVTTLNCVCCTRIKANKRIYNCTNAHLICKTCVQFPIDGDFSAPARCPKCNENAIQNLNAEERIAKLVEKCEFCDAEFENSVLDEHVRELCDKRPVFCKYKIVGCDWNDIAADKTGHENDCLSQQKSGDELLEAYNASATNDVVDNALILMFSADSFKLVNIRLVKMPENPWYESAVFNAANLNWKIETRIEENIANPKLTLLYALKVTSHIPADTKYMVRYAALGGPMQLKPSVLDFYLDSNCIKSNFKRLLEFDEPFNDFGAPITFRLLISLKF